MIEQSEQSTANARDMPKKGQGIAKMGLRSQELCSVFRECNPMIEEQDWTTVPKPNELGP
jgi:hypothetical protein